MKTAMYFGLALLMVSLVSAEVHLEKRPSWIFGSPEMFLVTSGLENVYLKGDAEGFTLWQDRIFGDAQIGTFYRLGNSYKAVLDEGNSPEVLIDLEKFHVAHVALSASFGASEDLTFVASQEKVQLEGFEVTGPGSLIGYDSEEFGHLDWVDNRIYRDSEGNLYKDLGDQRVMKVE